MSTTLTIVDVLRSDLTRPISCTAANKLETEKSAPFNLTVYCKYCPTRVAAPRISKVKQRLGSCTTRAPRLPDKGHV